MDQERLHKKEIREEFWDRGHQRQNASSFDKKNQDPNRQKGAQPERESSKIPKVRGSIGIKKFQ